MMMMMMMMISARIRGSCNFFSITAFETSIVWLSLSEFLLTECAFVSELTEQKLTVGKIYAGLLIAENWKSFKATGKTGGRTAVDCDVLHFLSLSRRIIGAGRGAKRSGGRLVLTLHTKYTEHWAEPVRQTYFGAF